MSASASVSRFDSIRVRIVFFDAAWKSFFFGIAPVAFTTRVWASLFVIDMPPSKTSMRYGGNPVGS